ncbi:MAG: ABC transporter substrate-binding protein [Desulfobacterales bacterium]|nr:ABC transporter substrate-binding protein [Desulfobacterales bacterium]
MNKSAVCLLFLMVMFALSPPGAWGEIKIAAIYSLTGAGVESNAPSVQGVRCAVNDVNAGGGVLGEKINLLLFDNFSSPIGSSIAAERAAEAEVIAIVGASWSSHSIAIARVAQAKKIPMISDVSTNPGVTKTGDYIFRACYTDDFQGEVMARFARRDLNASAAVVFTDMNSDYSITLSRIFKEKFEGWGGEILVEAMYKHKQERFGELILQTKKAKPDVLFLSGHDESGLIAKQIQDAGVSTIFLGGDGWDARAFYTRGGSELKRGYYCTHWSEMRDSERSRSFAQKYKHIHEIGVGAPLGYDAMMVLADAIRRAGSRDRAKIRDALANTRSFQGVTGAFTFDANGDPIKSVVIMEINHGKPRYLKTLHP